MEEKEEHKIYVEYNTELDGRVPFGKEPYNLIKTEFENVFWLRINKIIKHL